MQPFGSGDKPIIHYPCEWTYKLVGREEPALRAAVAGIVSSEYSLVPSKKSTKGKYLSLELVLTVHTDEERQGIGRRLHEHPDVIFVF